MLKERTYALAVGILIFSGLFLTACLVGLFMKVPDITLVMSLFMSIPLGTFGVLGWKTRSENIVKIKNTLIPPIDNGEDADDSNLPNI